MIKLNELNDDLRTGQLAIFVHCQWSLGTSSLTHMQDLEMDRRPDENPRHLKNIKKYIQLFQKFDLDYLTVQTHTLGQSKYNPVERSIATLSKKLAGITLPIDHFRIYLDTQGKVINLELALQNFRYAREVLCDI
ncbi:15166_t:CDS:2 [Funneliformis geosporum]|uniref:15166_t:CDS:1 n=1 Tax=Funneliformis geosporum TaxID=1117311 RepID=A0A9W4SV67_9GLOM|nr:15166_t:CDS:2 [Funneliformis geosporum]